MIVCTFVGNGIFAFMVGRVTALASQMNASHQLFVEKLDSVVRLPCLLVVVLPCGTVSRGAFLTRGHLCAVCVCVCARALMLLVQLVCTESTRTSSCTTATCRLRFATASARFITRSGTVVFTSMRTPSSVT